MIDKMITGEVIEGIVLESINEEFMKISILIDVNSKDLSSVGSSLIIDKESHTPFSESGKKEYPMKDIKLLRKDKLRSNLIEEDLRELSSYSFVDEMVLDATIIQKTHYLLIGSKNILKKDLLTDGDKYINNAFIYKDNGYEVFYFNLKNIKENLISYIRTNKTDVCFINAEDILKKRKNPL